MNLAKGNLLSHAWGLNPGGDLNTFQWGSITLVPFSHAAQFKHHGGGRRGQTFRQRLVQVQEGFGRQGITVLRHSLLSHSQLE